MYRYIWKYVWKTGRCTKSIVLAVSIIAIKEKRKCFIISFSGELKFWDLLIQKSDIMVISDFEMFDICKKTMETMNLEKSLGTRFHSMLVEKFRSNQEVLKKFDVRWEYKGADKAGGICFSCGK